MSPFLSLHNWSLRTSSVPWTGRHAAAVTVKNALKSTSGTKASLYMHRYIDVFLLFLCMCPGGDRRSWVASEIDPHLLRITGKNNMTEHLLPPPHLPSFIASHCSLRWDGPKVLPAPVDPPHYYSANIKRNLTAKVHSLGRGEKNYGRNV